MARTSQLTVNLEPGRIEQIEAAAHRAGLSTQDWVVGALSAAVDAPASTNARVLVANLHAELSEIVSTGEYQRWADALDDPDLA